MIETGLIAARFAHYLALVLTFGAFAYCGAAWGAVADQAARRTALGASLALVVTTLAVLLATVAGLGGSLDAARDPTLWSAVLGETDFGRVWAIRIAMAVLLLGVAVLFWRRAGRMTRAAGVLLSGGLLTTVALTGHAQIESGAEGFVHRAADAIHLVAAAAWIGALPPFLVLLRRTRPDCSIESLDFAARQLQAFHSIGLAAVLLLLATGLVNSWFLVGDVARLFDTPYGLVLLAKLALFGGMVALAADNRLRLVPGLVQAVNTGRDARGALGRLRRHVRAELVLGALVLLAVAIMGAIAPAVEGSAG